MEDPTDVHSREEAELTALQATRQREAREREDVRWLMAHAQGRRLVWRYLSDCGVFRSTHVFDDPGGRNSALNEGRRQIGLRILDDVMTHAPEAYQKMTDENARVH